jgi:hypothetical protein
MKIAPANDLGRLAPASEVAGRHAIKCFKIGKTSYLRVYDF